MTILRIAIISSSRSKSNKSSFVRVELRFNRDFIAGPCLDGARLSSIHIYRNYPVYTLHRLLRGYII